MRGSSTPVWTADLLNQSVYWNILGESILRVLHLPKLLGSAQHPRRVVGNLTSEKIE